RGYTSQKQSGYTSEWAFTIFPRSAPTLTTHSADATRSGSREDRQGRGRSTILALKLRRVLRKSIRIIRSRTGLASKDCNSYIDKLAAFLTRSPPLIEIWI